MEEESGKNLETEKMTLNDNKKEDERKMLEKNKKKQQIKNKLKLEKLKM